MNVSAHSTDDDTLDLEGAARYLHLGVNATRDLFDAGEIPGVSLNQKHTVFLRGDLAAYIRKTAQEQAAARRKGTTPPSPAMGKERARRGPTRRPLPDLSKHSP